MLNSEVNKPGKLETLLLAFDSYLEHFNNPLPEALADFSSVYAYPTTDIGFLTKSLTEKHLLLIWRGEHPLTNIATAFIKHTQRRLRDSSLVRCEGDSCMLLYAMKHLIHELVLVLYRHVRCEGDRGETMNWAIHFGDLNIVTELHASGFQLSEYALRIAVLCHRLDIVKWLHETVPEVIAYPGVQQDMMNLIAFACSAVKDCAPLIRYLDSTSYKLLQGHY